MVTVMKSKRDIEDFIAGQKTGHLSPSENLNLRDRICKVWFNAPGRIDVDFPRENLPDGKDEYVRFQTEDAAIDFIFGYLHGVLDEGGDFEFTAHINQGDRECSIVDRKKSRVRVQYEMPNAGLMGGWIPFITLPDGSRYILANTVKHKFR